jgi:hypothetical protein
MYSSAGRDYKQTTSSGQFKYIHLARLGDVAQWASHPPHEPKTRVRIPPGYAVFMENMAMLLCIVDLNFVFFRKRAFVKNSKKYPG